MKKRDPFLASEVISSAVFSLEEKREARAKKQAAKRPASPPRHIVHTLQIAARRAKSPEA